MKHRDLLKNQIERWEGGQIEKAFHYFQFNREEYLSHYHLRSNIESTFSAVKRKFGDSVMSKTDTAMTNEALCKLLCHNLTCLIQEQETLGIVPIFWPNEDVPDDEPQREEGGAVLLRMRR